MNIKNILLIIIFIYVIYLHSKINNIKNIENFAVTDDIRAVVKEIYNTDMEAVRQLAVMATKLNAGGLEIPGNLIVTGTIKSTGDISSANYSLSGLNNSITNNNNNITNSLNATNSSLGTTNANLNATNNNFSNYVRYSDDFFRITNQGTGNNEGSGNYLGLCGRGDCGLINAVLIDDLNTSKFKIVKASSRN